MLDVHDEHHGSDVGASRSTLPIIPLVLSLLGGFTVIGVLLVAAPRAAVHAERASAAPLLVQNSTSDGGVDLGALPKGVTREFPIRISNPSPGQAVHIDRITSSCGCTVARGAPLTIEPRQSADIPVTISLPGNRSSEWGVSIALHLADGDRQAIPIRFSLPSPFPSRVAPADRGGSTRIPVAALYQTLIEDVEVFPLGSTAPIPSRLSADGDAVEIRDLPPGSRTVELVVTTAGELGAPTRFTERVQLSQHTKDERSTP